MSGKVDSKSVHELMEQFDELIDKDIEQAVRVYERICSELGILFNDPTVADEEKARFYYYHTSLLEKVDTNRSSIRQDLINRQNSQKKIKKYKNV